MPFRYNVKPKIKATTATDPMTIPTIAPADNFLPLLSLKYFLPLLLPLLELVPISPLSSSIERLSVKLPA